MNSLSERTWCEKLTWKCCFFVFFFKSAEVLLMLAQLGFSHNSMWGPVLFFNHQERVRIRSRWGRSRRCEVWTVYNLGSHLGEKEYEIRHECPGSSLETYVSVVRQPICFQGWALSILWDPALSGGLLGSFTEGRKRAFSETNPSQGRVGPDNNNTLVIRGLILRVWGLFH